MFCSDVWAIGTGHFQLPTTPMNLRLTPCLILLSATLWPGPCAVMAKEPQVAVEQLLQSTKSWDGTVYKGYPTGQPQVTVLRIKIPPHTSLHWHSHPVISVGYIISGQLTVEKTGDQRTHNGPRWRGSAGNSRHYPSRFHDRQPSRADRLLRRASRNANYCAAGVRARREKEFRSSGVAGVQEERRSYT